jgi:hypothetical protein
MISRLPEEAWHIRFRKEAWSMFKLLASNAVILAVVALLGTIGAWCFLWLSNPVSFITLLSHIGAAVCIVYCIGITWEHSKKG